MQKNFSLSSMLLGVITLSNIFFLFLANKYLLFNKKTIIICSFSFFLGAFWYQQQQNTFYGFLQRHLKKSYTLVGTITDIEQRDHPYLKYKITVKTEALYPNNHKNFHEKEIFEKNISLYLPSLPPLQIADRISIAKLTIKQPNNTFFCNYLMRNNISATFFIKKQQITILERPSWSLQRWLFNKKKSLITISKKNLSPITYMLYSSIFLGYKPDDILLSTEFTGIRKQFTIWGIAHYLARSGLHMTIFAMLSYYFLNLLPLLFIIKEIISLIMGCLLFLFSWPAVPFLRAFGLFLFYKACTFSYFPIHFLHLLSLVTLGILIMNPIQLFFVDFQLSFGLTYTLAFITHLRKISKPNY